MKGILGLFRNMNANEELIKHGQDVLKQVRASGRVVEFQHVQGHSSHKWNDMADTLANRGRKMPQ
jgi:ribonuclease HI